MVERDVIGHLMDVEHEASDLILEATKEADRRKAVARENAAVEYTKAYTPMIQECEQWLDAGKKACSSARDEEYADYSEHLTSLPKDVPAFIALLDSILAVQ